MQTFCKTIIAVAAAAATLSTAHAQTVQVSKTGGIPTIQAAIDTFSGDVDPAPNIIQISDGEVYDETITVNAPVTIEGTGATKPRVTVQSNPNGREGSAGLVVNLPGSITTDTVVLRNLAIMPSLTVTADISAAVNVYNNNAFLFLDDVIITGNDGADQPITTDGTTNAGENGAHKHFADDLVVAGETDALQVGDGVELLLRDTIISNNRGVGAQTHGVHLANNTETPGFRKLGILDGCVISYNGFGLPTTLGYGIVATGDVEINAPNDRLILTGMTYGIFFNGDSPNERLVRGAIIANMAQSGIYENSISGQRMTIEDSIIGNNSRHGFWTLGTLESPVTLRRSTIGNANSTSYNSIRIAPANTAPIIIEDSIIIGNGSANANNVIYNESTSPITVTNSAIVLEGLRSMSGTGYLNTATVTETNVTNEDPVFVESQNIYSSAFYHVSNPAYLTLASNGDPLVGGGEFFTITEDTVTVSKTGTADFDTVQAAINSQTADLARRLRIEILDSSVYDEMITMNIPASIIGTGTERPILAVQSNPEGFDQDGANAATSWNGDAGLLINLPIDTFTSAKVELKNLVIIPSRNSPSATPPVAGIVNKANNFYLEMENLLVTSNNGSDEPVNTDGLADAGTVNTSFRVSGAHIGSITNDRPEGAGVEVRMRDCIFTNIKASVGGTWRTGMYMNRTYYVYGYPAPAGVPLRPTAFRELTIDSKCIFSYNNGDGLRCAASLIIETPEDRSLFINNLTSGLWMDQQGGYANANRNDVNGIIVANNTGIGINEGVATGGPRMNLMNSIVANNGSYGVYHRQGAAAQIPSRYLNVTVANNSQNNPTHDQVQGSPANHRFYMQSTDTIFAGSGNTANANNRIYWQSQGDITIVNTALVEEGPFAFSNPSTVLDNGNLIGDPVTTADPMFVNTEVYTSPDFYAVSNAAYGTLSSTGGPLVGGSIFAPASVSDWSVY